MIDTLLNATHPLAQLAACIVGLLIGLAACAIFWFLLAAVAELVTWRSPNIVRFPKK